MAKLFEGDLFADYFQFYLEDDVWPPQDNKDNLWGQDAYNRRLAVTPHSITVATARNMSVPVTVSLSESKPEILQDEFDHINLCSLSVTSGRLVIAGCTDYWPDAARITLGAPGTYRAIICYKNLNSLSEDELEGDDSYHVFLFPDDPIEPKILKEFKGS